MFLEIFELLTKKKESSIVNAAKLSLNVKVKFLDQWYKKNHYLH